MKQNNRNEMNQDTSSTLFTFQQEIRRHDVIRADHMLPNSKLDRMKMKNIYFFIGIALLGLLLLISDLSKNAYSNFGYLIKCCFIILLIIILIMYTSILLGLKKNRAYFILKKQVNCLFQIRKYYDDLVEIQEQNNSYDCLKEYIELRKEVILIRNSTEIDESVIMAVDSDNNDNEIMRRYDTIIETKEDDNYIVLYWIDYGVVLQKRELGAEGISIINSQLQASSTSNKQYSVIDVALKLDHKDYSNAQELEFVRTHNNIYLLLLSSGVLFAFFYTLIYILQVKNTFPLYYIRFQNQFINRYTVFAIFALIGLFNFLYKQDLIFKLMKNKWKNTFFLYNNRSKPEYTCMEIPITIRFYGTYLMMFMPSNDLISSTQAESVTNLTPTDCTVKIQYSNMHKPISNKYGLSLGANIYIPWNQISIQDKKQLKNFIQSRSWGCPYR